MMNKEDFCRDCGFVTYYPPAFIDPGGSECPADFDPDSEECPRHQEWLEELKGEEEYDEVDEIESQKLQRH